MALNRMMYCSTQQGYTATIGDGVIKQDLDGGEARYRRTLKGVNHSVTSRWVVKKAGFQYLMAFYRVWARKPSQPFIARFCIDDAEVDDHQCFFDGPPVLSEKSKDVFTVTATLKVKPKKIDAAQDDIIVEVGNSGNDLATLLNPLEKLVNEDLPNALG